MTSLASKLWGTPMNTERTTPSYFFPVQPPPEAASDTQKWIHIHYVNGVTTYFPRHQKTLRDLILTTSRLKVFSDSIDSMVLWKMEYDSEIDDFKLRRPQQTADFDDFQDNYRENLSKNFF